MRTVAGLIVGLGLGILLMYFAVSSFRAVSLKPQPRPVEAGPPVPTPSSTVTLPSRLGAAAADAALAGLADGAAVLLVASTLTPDAALAAEGFQAAIAGRTGIRLLSVAHVGEALPLLDGAACVFCADHSRLGGLLAAAEGHPLPPVYTVGWSAWLIEACGAPRSPITGVAVADPSFANRLLTPCFGDPAESAFAAVGARAVVLTPAQVIAAFGAPAGTGAAQPTPTP
jgi:hypothetical protein